MLDGTPLLVAVRATDEQRRATMKKLVEGAGHRVGAEDRADVILSDTKQPSPERPIIVLSEQTSPADNHLPVDVTPRQLDAALRAVTAGLSVRIGRSAPRRGFEELGDLSAHSILSPREIDVIEAISAGLSNKAIARELGISLHTVKFHIESLLRKLGARTRAEAVAKAMERRKKETIDL
jgi:DNA-binding NarL/FixJ family response regulator